ncbi:hypothetical protein NX059_002378 [Plenodomus lindquistii]|nr:hypothetical protein NX059_002378 [Plenodomus lindquistii]
MYLLDTPPEIFQHIIHDLVTVIGCCKAWKLRTVCRTFAVEIRHDILANRSIADLESPGIATVVDQNLGILLSNRSLKPLDADTALLDKIETLGQYLLKELEMCLEASQEALTLFRQNFASLLGQRRVLRLLRPAPSEPLHTMERYSERHCAALSKKSDNETLKQPMTLSEKLCAAISVGSHGLVHQLLSVVRGFELTREGFFGSPLKFAIAQASQGMLELICDYLECPGVPGYPIQDLLSVERLRWGYVSDTALRFAIKTGQMEAFELLNAHYQLYFGPYARSLHDELLFDAIDSRSPRMVRIVLHVPVKRGASVTLHHMQRAARCLSVDVMLEVVTAHGMRINKIYKNSSPLIAAVRENALDVVKGLLGAGADVDMMVGQGSKGKNAMDVAMNAGRYLIVETLLAHGAEIPNVSAWPEGSATKRGRYSRVRAALEDERRRRGGSK